MTDGQALVAAICGAPEDDTPRLVYADWLDDHGQPQRAEFIRVQCELARGVADAERRDALRRRERELLVAHEREWAGPLCRVVRRAGFARGFIERVTVHAERLPDAVALFSSVPVRHLILLGAKDFTPLSTLPELRRITTLDLREGFAADAVGALHLADAPALGGVVNLVLRQCSVEPDGAAVLGGAPALARLRTLDLYDDNAGADVLAPLARSPHLAGLTTLVLGGNRLGDDGMREFAGSHCRLASLRRLHLSYCEIGDVGARSLAAAPSLAGLEYLNLAGNPLGRAGRRVLKARFGDRVRF